MGGRGSGWRGEPRMGGTGAELEAALGLPPAGVRVQ